MTSLRERIYTIIFKTDTRAGKQFDVLLLVLILASVVVVVFESVKPLRSSYPLFFSNSEWAFTIVFTIEYLLRLFSHPKPLKYASSFLGVIDLIAILPSYFGLVVDQANFLLVVRAIRLLRVFRILKLTRYIREADQLASALVHSARKIIIFFEVVIVLVLFMGTIMYLVEGEHNGFTSIPQSIYWAIVTITTVGYGDIAPVTVPGKLIASLAMLLGYSIIAVPTGIITVEIGKMSSKKNIEKQCSHCNHATEEQDAAFCSKCGNKYD